MKYRILIILVFTTLGCDLREEPQISNSLSGKEETIPKDSNFIAVIYANRGRIIAKLNQNDKWPGKLFSVPLLTNSNKKEAVKEITKELNTLYGKQCNSSEGSACTLDEIAGFDSYMGRIEIFNCPECSGSNAGNNFVPGIYHISTHDDAVEVGSKLGNSYVGEYEPQTHDVFKLIQERPNLIKLLKAKGLIWGI
jgi:hypothetical protein